MKNTDELKSKMNVTNVTLTELADQVGTTRMSLYRWDNGGAMPSAVSSFVKGLNYMPAIQKHGKSYSVGQMQALANEIKRLRENKPDSNLVAIWEAWKLKNNIKGTFVSVDDIRKFLESV